MDDIDAQLDALLEAVQAPVEVPLPTAPLDDAGALTQPVETLQSQISASNSDQPFSISDAAVGQGGDAALLQCTYAGVDVCPPREENTVAAGQYADNTHVPRAVADKDFMNSESLPGDPAAAENPFETLLHNDTRALFHASNLAAEHVPPHVRQLLLGVDVTSDAAAADATPSASLHLTLEDRQRVRTGMAAHILAGLAQATDTQSSGIIGCDDPRMISDLEPTAVLSECLACLSRVAVHDLAESLDAMVAAARTECRQAGKNGEEAFVLLGILYACLLVKGASAERIAPSSDAVYVQSMAATLGLLAFDTVSRAATADGAHLSVTSAIVRWVLSHANATRQAWCVAPEHSVLASRLFLRVLNDCCARIRSDGDAAALRVVQNMFNASLQRASQLWRCAAELALVLPVRGDAHDALHADSGRVSTRDVVLACDFLLAHFLQVDELASRGIVEKNTRLLLLASCTTDGRHVLEHILRPRPQQPDSAPSLARSPARTRSHDTIDADDVERGLFRLCHRGWLHSLSALAGGMDGWQRAATAHMLASNWHMHLTAVEAAAMECDPVAGSSFPHLVAEHGGAAFIDSVLQGYASVDDATQYDATFHQVAQQSVWVRTTTNGQHYYACLRWAGETDSYSDAQSKLDAFRSANVSDEAYNELCSMWCARHIVALDYVYDNKAAWGCVPKGELRLAHGLPAEVKARLETIDVFPFAAPPDATSITRLPSSVRVSVSDHMILVDPQILLLARTSRPESVVALLGLVANWHHEHTPQVAAHWRSTDAPHVDVPRSPALTGVSARAEAGNDAADRHERGAPASTAQSAGKRPRPADADDGSPAHVSRSRTVAAALSSSATTSTPEAAGRKRSRASPSAPSPATPAVALERGRGKLAAAASPAAGRNPAAAPPPVAPSSGSARRGRAALKP